MPWYDLLTNKPMNKKEYCHYCSSTDILKYDGECNPVCVKCAGGPPDCQEEPMNKSQEPDDYSRPRKIRRKPTHLTPKKKKRRKR